MISGRQHKMPGPDSGQGSLGGQPDPGRQSQAKALEPSPTSGQKAPRYRGFHSFILTWMSLELRYPRLWAGSCLPSSPWPPSPTVNAREESYIAAARDVKVTLASDWEGQRGMAQTRSAGCPS